MAITPNAAVADISKLCDSRIMHSKITIILLLAVLLGTGCATLTTEDQAGIFLEPARFEGQEVNVCGRLRGTSNIYSSRDKDQGLSIWASEETASIILQQFKKQKSACIRGTIEYLGCETGADTICVDAAFDYAVRVAEVT